MWDSAEWIEDPSLVFVIANAVDLAHRDPAAFAEKCLAQQETAATACLPLALTNRPVTAIPGYNVDRIDIAAGLRALRECGYTEPRTVEVMTYALQRHARGEEAAAQRGAIDQRFHGIDLTSRYRVLAAAQAAAEQAAKQDGDAPR